MITPRTQAEIQNLRDTIAGLKGWREELIRELRRMGFRRQVPAALVKINTALQAILKAQEEAQA